MKGTSDTVSIPGYWVDKIKLHTINISFIQIFSLVNQQVLCRGKITTDITVVSLTSPRMEIMLSFMFICLLQDYRKSLWSDHGIVLRIPKNRQQTIRALRKTIKRTHSFKLLYQYFHHRQKVVFLEVFFC